MGTTVTEISQLAAAVLSARRAKEWSKERAAHEAKISSITWKKVEDGQPVQEQKLAAIGKALGWPPDYIFALAAGRETAEPPQPDDDLMEMVSSLAREIEDLKRRIRDRRRS